MMMMMMMKMMMIEVLIKCKNIVNCYSIPLGVLLLRFVISSEFSCVLSSEMYPNM